MSATGSLRWWALRWVVPENRRADDGVLIAGEVPAGADPDRADEFCGGIDVGCRIFPDFAGAAMARAIVESGRFQSQQVVQEDASSRSIRADRTPAVDADGHAIDPRRESSQSPPAIQRIRADCQSCATSRSGVSTTRARRSAES